METKGENIGEASDAREKLIKEGAPRYLQAVVALREFQRVIQEGCKNIVSNRLEEIAMATKLPLQEKMVWDYPSPGTHTEETGWDGKSAWLAAGITFPDVGDMYFGLCWDYWKGPEPVLLAIGTLTLKSRELFDKAWKKLAKRNDKKFHNYQRENREISVYEIVPLKQAASFPDKLEVVIDVWLGAWNEVGGISGLSSKEPKAKEH
jgi:hypothetical protein